MELLERTKIVPIKGREYRLRKLEPFIGGHIYLRIMGVISKEAEGRPAPVITPEDEAEMDKLPRELRAKMMINLAFMRGFSLLESQTYSKLALAVVDSAGPNNSFTPVMGGDRWADKELEHRPEVIQDLVLESLTFNLTCFLPERGKQTT